MFLFKHIFTRCVYIISDFSTLAGMFSSTNTQKYLLLKRIKSNLTAEQSNNSWLEKQVRIFFVFFIGHITFYCFAINSISFHPLGDESVLSLQQQGLFIKKGKLIFATISIIFLFHFLVAISWLPFTLQLIHDYAKWSKFIDYVWLSKDWII